MILLCFFLHTNFYKTHMVIISNTFYKIAQMKVFILLHVLFEQEHELNFPKRKYTLHIIKINLLS